ncbi:DUF1549 domain-containing protein [Candidatus Laterigemmans baculatus]|uniref:DUF1549 domain-containing protein n=1 Tax=Candidatus Laterigemmans baculatus TaxID=2770505 RepID=UPI0013D97F90|nr:DUF1549 domain-containing protein [Candidatus Laterigemmans baculatus]
MIHLNRGIGDHGLGGRLGGCLLALAALAAPSRSLAAEPTIDFSHEVVPVLREHCVECHGDKEAKGGFSINSRSLIVDSGSVDLESPGDSYLLELITSSDPDLQMPPADHERLSGLEVAVLRRWIVGGLPWEEGFSFGATAYEPPLHPRLPELPPVVAGRTNPIDRILDNYLAERDLPTPAPIDDALFYRRVHLDLVGLLPEPEALAAFVADPASDKRERAVETLLEKDLAYADHWLTFFNDLLRNDYSGTGFITGGRRQITGWLYAALLDNMPFDQFARELIAPPTAESGGYIEGIKWRGEVSAGQTVEIQFAQNVSQSFLGINMKCASCHDSFIDRWTLEEAYGLAAIYATEPLEIHRCDKPVGKTAEAGWLFPKLGQIDPQAPQPERLQQLAGLMTHPENGRFTRTIVNRLWYKLMGRGIVHPLDAMQSEPWNADLLDYLAWYLAEEDYDLKRVLRLIATSHAYQSASEVTAAESGGGTYTYRGPLPRRLTAEQFLDAVWQLTGEAPSAPDAAVVRSLPPSGDAAEVDALPPVPVQWIWGGASDGVPPAGQQLVLRKTLKLEEPIARGAAVFTCDNEFVLYVNGREVERGDNWTTLHTLPLRGRLKQGDNQFVFVVKNAGDAPNPAGLMLAAAWKTESGTVGQWGTDATWQWSPTLPQPREGRLGNPPGPWKPAHVVEPVASWTETIGSQVQSQLVLAAAGETPMVRASLLKNNALMRSLGRPTRDQVVSMRPPGLTTLEAIDLANEQTLADAFAAGGEHLLEKAEGDPDAVLRHLYAFALSREPTDDERAVLRERLGERPTAAAVQDVLWAVCMLPEFLLVR